MNQKEIIYYKEYDSFEIAHSERKSSYNMSSNQYHDNYEIYYLLSGERYYFINDRTYHITKGDLVFINLNDLHRTMDAGTRSHERIRINFKSNFLDSYSEAVKDVDLFSVFNQNYKVAKLNAYEQNYIEKLFFRMIDESKNNLVGFNTCLKISLIDMLIFLKRHFSDSGVVNYIHPSLLHKKISDIAVYISKNYMHHLTLSYIAEKFFFSPDYFCRIFKKTTGFTFVEYLNITRIKEAQKLLIESDFSVSDIAGKVGYENATHFGRVFKDITGLSPLKYRKNNCYKS